MPNRIFRGAELNTPKTITTKFVSGGGSWLPGTAVIIGGAAAAGYPNPQLILTQATNANRGTIGLLAASDTIGKPIFAGGPDLLEANLGAGDYLVYVIEPDQQYQWRCAAGYYAFGQELTIGAGGQLKAAVSGDVVVAFNDRGSMTTIDGTLMDVVIANSYRKA